MNWRRLIPACLRHPDPIVAVLAEIRASGCTPDRMLRLASLIQDSCKPASVAVLVIDKADLARAAEGVRRARLAGLLSWLASLYPEWEIGASRKPETRPDSVC